MILNDTSEIVYGAFHVYNMRFFKSVYGEKVWNISVKDFPHYHFLEMLETPRLNDDSYDNYLKFSWDKPELNKTNTEAGRRAKKDEFIALYRKIKANPHILLEGSLDGICGARRKDGKIALVHGFHRTAIAAFLNLPIEINLIEDGAYALHFYFNRRLAKKPEIFSGKDMPYQSVFDGEKEVVAGRRPDIRTRYDKIRKEDVVGKSIIDFGCNIGSNMFMALEDGAKFARGIEMSPDMIDIGLRVNSYFAKNVDFVLHNLNDPIYPGHPLVEPIFDTIFCMSVAGYVKDWKNFANVLIGTGARVMYFEGHIGKKEEDYKELFSYFPKVEFLGYNQDQRGVERESRPFFRCER